MNNKELSHKNEYNKISSKRYLKTDNLSITDFFPNLETLIAKNLKYLKPEQAPNLEKLNSYDLDIKLSDFPKLNEVYDHKTGQWEEISWRMKDIWYHYKNWSLFIPPLNCLFQKVTI